MRILLLAAKGERQPLSDSLRASSLVSAVTPCPSAAAAQATLAATPDAFDIVVIEQDLPDGDGLSLCQELFGLKTGLPLVLLSSADSEKLSAESSRFGVEACLPRPGNRRQQAALPAALQEVLRKHGDRVAREQAVEGLRESHQRLKQVVEASNVPSFVIDHEHRITEWNRACELLTGLPAEQMLGSKDQWKAFWPRKRPVLADFVLEDAPEEAIANQYGEAYQASLLGEGFEVEEFFPHLGEEGRWLFFTAAPLRDSAGRIIGAIETLQDVTRRRQAEDALRESEQRYRELSITDGLTGLYNARHFHSRLDEEAERSDRYAHPLTLLMLDMDDFKEYNDRYGHPEGDKVLQRLAASIQRCIRHTDSVYRYGGEEFAVILPETGIEEAVMIAERIRLGFAEEVFKPPQGGAIRKTLSIGAAQMIPHEEVSLLIRRADHNLYQAKRQGKNLVVPAAGS